MNNAALMVCKGFIQRCPPHVQEGLLSLLSPTSRASLTNLPIPAPLESTLLKWDLLDQIHYSWLSPYLRTLTENEVRLFLGVLTQEQVHGLVKILGLENHIPPLPKLAKKSLRKILVSNVTQGQTLVPLAFLPEHPFNTLLAKSSTALTKLIRFLGLHDLSIEVRQIISTAELKKVFASLSKKESDYLHQIMLHREPLVFERLFLGKWDGTKEQLHKLLEERGLQRLGHALWNGSESLLWHITHKLDMHLGTLLIKYRKKPTHERSEKILREQIEKILRQLNHEEQS